MTATDARRVVKPVLVYWHCGSWWPLEDGRECPMDHDAPIYDHRPRKGRKRRVWICHEGEGGRAYLTRKGFLEHDEEWCFAS